MRYPERLSFLASRRGLVPRLASTGYVVAAAMKIEGGRGPRVWGLGAAAIALSALSSRVALRPSSLALWGTSLALAAMATSQTFAWMDALGVVGALVATIAACAALARMSAHAPAVPTLVPHRDRSPRLAILAVSVGWGAALAAEIAAALTEGHAPDAHGFAVTLGEQAPAIAMAAATLSGGAIAISCEMTLRDRLFVLGIADRVRVARALCLTLLAATFGVCFVVPAASDRVLRLGVVVIALLVAGMALHGDAVRLVRAWRRACVLAVIGGPIVLLAAMAADGQAGVVFAGTLVALVVGSFVGELEGPLRPADGAWLDALERAGAALTRTDASTALRDAIAALRAPAGPEASSPELWTFDASVILPRSAEAPNVPSHVATVDAAGYARERASDLPARLVEIAAGEPEATIRAEVLEALEVRRPDLRSLSRWMRDRGALTVTVIAAAGEPLGLLLLPRGRRVAHVTLEEARAMKSFADALAGTCEARGALARSLAREQAMTTRAEAAEEQVLHLEQARSIEVGRHVLAASRVARPATVGVYSAASRMSFEALERRVKAGAPVTLVAPSGVDPVPYLARAHLGGPRRAEPLVLVDGTSSREHDLGRWTDPKASPLALADRGMLVLVDGPSLPADVQRLIAQALAERRPPWERALALDIALAVTATAPLTTLLAAGRLEHSLATRLGDGVEDPITLPRLSERPEDIRAILTDRLAREGLRVRGTPVGIEDAAFARLAEYAFPGEDAELVSIVQRLVAGLRGDVVRAADVDALRLVGAQAGSLGEREIGRLRGV